MAVPEALQRAIEANRENAEKSASEMMATLMSPDPRVWARLDKAVIQMKEAQRIYKETVSSENAAAGSRIAESVEKLAVKEKEEMWFTAGLGSRSKRERAANERVLMDLVVGELKNGIDMIRLVTGEERDRIVVGYGIGKHRRYSEVGVMSDENPSYDQVVAYCAK
jgi:hypothetical protein